MLFFIIMICRAKFESSNFCSVLISALDLRDKFSTFDMIRMRKNVIRFVNQKIFHYVLKINIVGECSTRHKNATNSVNLYCENDISLLI